MNGTSFVSCVLLNIQTENLFTQEAASGEVYSKIVVLNCSVIYETLVKTTTSYSIFMASGSHEDCEECFPFLSTGCALLNIVTRLLDVTIRRTERSFFDRKIYSFLNCYFTCLPVSCNSFVTACVHSLRSF